jgi:hypothetical protein
MDRPLADCTTKEMVMCSRRDEGRNFLRDARRSSTPSSIYLIVVLPLSYTDVT